MNQQLACYAVFAPFYYLSLYFTLSISLSFFLSLSFSLSLSLSLSLSFSLFLSLSISLSLSPGYLSIGGAGATTRPPRPSHPSTRPVYVASVASFADPFVHSRLKPDLPFSFHRMDNTVVYDQKPFAHYFGCDNGCHGD